MGLYQADGKDVCVGCHPVCKECDGPNADDCISCNDGYLKVDETTCATECVPVNSYIIDRTCYPCNSFCENCTGPALT